MTLSLGKQLKHAVLCALAEQIYHHSGGDVMRDGVSTWFGQICASLSASLRSSASSSRDPGRSAPAVQASHVHLGLASPTVERAAGSGATLAGMRYHWREDKSSIGVLNAAGWDTFNTLYAETDHGWDLPGDFELNTASQFARQDSIGDELLGEFETWTLGGQAALSYAGLVGTVAYTATGQGNNNLNPWGGTPLFNSVMISDFDRAGERAWTRGALRGSRRGARPRRSRLGARRRRSSCGRR